MRFQFHEIIYIKSVTRTK